MQANQRWYRVFYALCPQGQGAFLFGAKDMIEKPMDVLSQFPVRKSKRQKQEFRAVVRQYAGSLGYRSELEKGSFGSWNIVIGDPAKAKYLVTAHYDTCAALPVPNLVTPCNFWLFTAYQLLIAAIMVVPALAVGILVGRLTQEPLWAARITGILVYTAVFMMLLGPANKNNANDNTSGVVTVLEMARAMPPELRDRVCFVLFDLEEAGLFGSASYRRLHAGEIKNQTVLNLDCVGDGDRIMLFPTKKLKKREDTMAALRACCGEFGEKSIAIREKGFAVYPSDQKNFPYGVGICALRQNKLGLYLGRIHTKRDTVLEEANVELLKDRLIALIGGQ